MNRMRRALKGDKSAGTGGTHRLVTPLSLNAGRKSRNADAAVYRANHVDSRFNSYSDQELNRLRKLCVLCGKTATYFANSKNFCYRHRDDAMRENKAYQEKKWGKQ